MLKRAIATRYATALFELAKEKNILEKVEKNFPEVTELVETHEDLRGFLNHPAIGADEKKKVVANLIEGKVDGTLFDLICMMIDKGREGYLSLVMDEYKKLLMEHRGQVKAVVYTPFELSEGLRKEIVDRVSAAMKKTVLLEEVKDESLIGGVKIQIGDRVLDASISNMLAQIRETLTSARV